MTASLIRIGRWIINLDNVVSIDLAYAPDEYHGHDRGVALYFVHPDVSVTNVLEPPRAHEEVSPPLLDESRSSIPAPEPTRFRGGACGHYPLMTMREIAALPIERLAAKDCALLMWTTFPYLDQQIKLFEHWGFPYRTQFVTWTKLNRRGYDLPKDDPHYAPGKPYVLYRDGLFHSVFFGVGYYAKSNPEVCLMGMRGQVPTISDTASSVILAPLREHSRKPDEAYERIEQVFGDVPRIELFARQTAPGWAAAGNGIDGRDIGESIAALTTERQAA
jgi:N6-adenosine-specific RNA methylase IME4